MLAQPLTACAVGAMLCVGPHALETSSLTFAAYPTADTPSVVTLNCAPPGGTHPDPEHACEQLDSVDGNFRSLPSDYQACTLIYAPVQVRVYGHWKGEPVDYYRTYPNSCRAAVDSGHVFTF
jgi:hypothetical protein